MKKPRSRSPLKILKITCGCLAIVLAGFAILAALAWSWWQDSILVAPERTETINLTVKQGDTLTTIAEGILPQKGIKSLEAFKIYLRLNPQLPTSVQTGSYKLPPGLNVPQLIELFAKGPVISTIDVTIIEGLRLDEVANSIVGAYKQAGKDFDVARYLEIVTNPQKVTFSDDVQQFLSVAKPADKNLEGYLFPDTYTIAVDAGAKDIVELQIRTLQRRLSEAGLSAQDTGRLNSFNELLNMASIVQREAKRYEDMQMVSDVFLKRLEQGWFLDADATLLYPLKRWTPPLTTTELAQNTAYNTYKRLGLPPTPICNPGINAIKAVIDYKANPYFYYITDREGIKRYGRTLAEHEYNIRTYGLAF